MPCLITMKFKYRIAAIGSILVILIIISRLSGIFKKKSPVKCIKFAHESNKNSGT